MTIPIISDLIERLFGPAEDPHSRDDVKRRLQIVLAHDRLALDPQALEMMRQEIIAVVSRYVEVDFESLEFSLATNERVTALTANLPIRRIRPLGRGADQPINPEEEVEKIELASPAEAVALDAKETEAALKKFEADNLETHLHLDIDRTGPDVAALNELNENEDDHDEVSERSVIEEAEDVSEVLTSSEEKGDTERLEDSKAQDSKAQDSKTESSKIENSKIGSSKIDSLESDSAELEEKSISSQSNTARKDVSQSDSTNQTSA